MRIRGADSGCPDSVVAEMRQRANTGEVLAALAAAEVECDVSDHVFLTADQASLANLDEDVPCIQTACKGGFLVP